MKTFDPDELMRSQEWAKWSDCRDMVQEAHDIGYAAALEAQAARIATLEAALESERERCAAIAEGAAKLPNSGDQFANGWCSAAVQIAQAIRAALAKQEKA